MGEFILVANHTKREYLNPHDCGDGAKLMEVACSAPGTMALLALLIAESKGQWALDARLGSWAGDEVEIVREYSLRGVYEKVQESYENISLDVVCEAAELDPYLRSSLKLHMSWRLGTLPPQQERKLRDAFGMP